MISHIRGYISAESQYLCRVSLSKRDVQEMCRRGWWVGGEGWGRRGRIVCKCVRKKASNEGDREKHERKKLRKVEIF